MKCTLSDSLEWLYPDSSIAGEPVTALECDAPAGGVADVNILVTDAAPDAPLRYSSDAPDGEFFRLVDVPVERNTGPDAFTERDGGPRNEFVTRRAPFRVFDAMRPLTGEPFAPGAKVVALRFRLRLEPGAAGGRRVAIRVSQGEDEASLAFLVRVHDVGLPPVGSGSFPYTNWISYSSIAESHGVEAWSEDFFALLGQYARLMAYGRQNMFIVPLNPIFSVCDGRPVLDEARLERIVRIFTDAGLHYIEGGHFGTRTGGWNSPTFSTNIVRELATSPAGCEIIATMSRLPEW